MGIVRTGRHHRQLGVPPREEFRFQIRIGLFQRFGSGHSQTFHQPILRRLETALDAALGLRRVCRNPNDPQFCQRPTDLRGG
jgi:hypothetical protein